MLTILLAIACQAPNTDDPVVARLESMFDLRQAQVVDAVEWVKVESLILDQIRRERSVSSPRRIQVHELALAEAETTLTYRIAIRDAAKLALEHARKRAASGSPEEDVDQARARLDLAVKVATARIVSFESYIKSAQALVDSEKASFDLLTDQATTGTIPQIVLTQAELRLGLARSVHSGAVARREIARQTLADAERERKLFESGGSSRPVSTAELLNRITQLETEILRLEDETDFLRRRVQRLMDVEMMRNVNPASRIPGL